MRKAEWREVWAVSVTIKQDSSAKDFTGRVGQRKSGENANAGRIESKGRADRTESPCKCGLVCDYVDKLHGQNREDDDKRTHTSEKLTTEAIETTEADRVVHYLEN